MFLFSGGMSAFDYAIMNEWFDFILQKSAVTVDLIGMLFTVLRQSYCLVLPCLCLSSLLKVGSRR